MHEQEGVLRHEAATDAPDPGVVLADAALTGLLVDKRRANPSWQPPSPIWIRRVIAGGLERLEVSFGQVPAGTDADTWLEDQVRTFKLQLQFGAEASRAAEVKNLSVRAAVGNVFPISSIHIPNWVGAGKLLINSPIVVEEGLVIKFLSGRQDSQIEVVRLNKPLTGQQIISRVNAYLSPRTAKPKPRPRR